MTEQYQKKNIIFFEKMLDIYPGLWYYNTRKREGKPNKPERKERQ
jgi:hypothetical protein